MTDLPAARQASILHCRACSSCCFTEQAFESYERLVSDIPKTEGGLQSQLQSF